MLTINWRFVVAYAMALLAGLGFHYSQARLRRVRGFRWLAGPKWPWYSGFGLPRSWGDPPTWGDLLSVLAALLTLAFVAVLLG